MADSNACCRISRFDAVNADPDGYHRDQVANILQAESEYFAGDTERHKMAVALLGPQPPVTSNMSEMLAVGLDRSARLLAMKLWSRAAENPPGDGPEYGYGHRCTWAIVDWASADVRVAIKALSFIPRSEFKMEKYRRYLDLAWDIKPNPALQAWLHAQPKYRPPAPANQLELHLALSDDDYI